MLVTRSVLSRLSIALALLYLLGRHRSARHFVETTLRCMDLSPDGNISAGAVGINDCGQVVGSWGSVDPNPADGPPVNTLLCPCYAVLWQNGQEIFLNGTVPSEWNLLLALAINDRGEILARGELNGGPLGTVLLKPIPANERGDVPSVRSSAENKRVYIGPRALRRDQKGGFQEIW